MKPREQCEQIINDLIAEGYKFQISKHDLEKTIMLRRGIDERTVTRWIKALTTLEYIKQVNAYVYQLNPTMTPKLFEILKEKPQTKMM